MKTIYLDECGFTGEDLLNAAQPMFAIASHDYTAEECAAFKAAHFSRYQGDELKHQNLGGRPRGQGMVLDFLKAIRNDRRFFFGLAFKRYCLVLKIVDAIIEEDAHNNGFDLYKDGANAALGNMWYAFFTLEPTLFDTLGQAFQALFREPSPVTMRAFEQALSRVPRHEMFQEMATWIRGAYLRLGPQHFASLEPGQLDISAAVALPVVYKWRAKSGPGFDVIHDQSSNMVKSRALWDILLSPSAPPGLIGVGKDAVHFPIGVTKTTFASSKEHDGIQIADVLAGATAHWGRWRAGLIDADDYAEKLHAEFFDVAGPPICGSLLWPSLDIEPRHRPAGVESPIDYSLRAINNSPDGHRRLAEQRERRRPRR